MRLFGDRDLRPYRFLGWAWVVLAALFILTGGKPYYLAGMLPLLLGVGAVAVERWLGRGRARVRRAGGAIVVTTSMAVGGIIGLPLLGVEDLDPVLAANPDVGETVGWADFANQVARVRDQLPDGDRAVIFTANYGQAGAIDRYGLPPAFSGHNGYGEWEKPPGSRGPIVVVGFPTAAYLEERFADCTLRTTIKSVVDNDERGTPVRTCSGPRKPWRRLWPRLRRLG